MARASRPRAQCFRKSRRRILAAAWGGGRCDPHFAGAQTEAQRDAANSSKLLAAELGFKSPSYPLHLTVEGGKETAKEARPAAALKLFAANGKSRNRNRLPACGIPGRSRAAARARASGHNAFRDRNDAHALYFGGFPAIPLTNREDKGKFLPKGGGAEGHGCTRHRHPHTRG